MRAIAFAALLAGSCIGGELHYQPPDSGVAPSRADHNPPRPPPPPPKREP